MSINRTRKTDNFTQVSNDLIRDQRLSLRGKAIAVFLLSHPDDWSFTRDSVAKGMGVAVHQVKMAFAELRALGYLTNYVQRTPEGTYVSSGLILLESPNVRESDARVTVQSGDETDDALPSVRNPATFTNSLSREVSSSVTSQQREMLFTSTGQDTEQDTYLDKEAENRTAGEVLQGNNGSPSEQADYWTKKSPEYRELRYQALNKMRVDLLGAEESCSPGDREIFNSVWYGKSSVMDNPDDAERYIKHAIIGASRDPRGIAARRPYTSWKTLLEIDRVLVLLWWAVYEGDSINGSAEEKLEVESAIFRTAGVQLKSAQKSVVQRRHPELWAKHQVNQPVYL